MSQALKNDIKDQTTDVMSQVSVLRDEIANLTATVAEYGKKQGVHLKSVAAQTAAGVMDSGSATAQVIRTKAEDTYATTEQAIRANPATAVGVAAGIGFLVGLISARR